MALPSGPHHRGRCRHARPHASPPRRPHPPPLPRPLPAFSHFCLAALPPFLASFALPCAPSAAPLTFSSQLNEVPICSIVSAGVSMAFVTVASERLLRAVFHSTPRIQPSDEELCPHCAGFGSVICELCTAHGVLYISGTDVKRLCPVCQGEKRERCRRCAGKGTTGMKKRPPPDPTNRQ